MDEIFRKLAKERGLTDEDIDVYLSEKNQVQEQVTTSDIPAPVPTPETQPDQQSPITSDKPVEIMGRFNEYKPNVDVMSGGVNTGVDKSAPYGTPFELPEGDWVVEEATSGFDPQAGYIGNNDNSGYGNSVVVRNKATGEKMRISHLSDVSVQQGQTLKGGTIGKSGRSGNTNADHFDIEYYDANGNLSDVLQSPYKNAGGYVGGGGGNIDQNIPLLREKIRSMQYR